MDSRDSSTASPAAPNSSPDEEAAPFSALAREALFLFQSRKYSECLELLQQLAQKKGTDPKVRHNIAITEFFRDGFSNPRRLIEALYGVKRKSEELARTSLEEVEAASNMGSRATAGAKGNASTPENQPIVANSASIFYVDEFDQSVTILNIAVIWFHLCEYAKALSILEPLYNKIQAIDETIALHICLLLLDVALACHDVEKSADVLTYLEKPPVSSQVDNGSMMQQQSANLAGKSSSFPNSSSVADASDLGSSASVNTSEKSLARTFSEETLEYETMMSTLDISGQNLGSSLVFSSSNNFSRSAFDKSVPSVDLKLKLQLYKVRFLLLAGNVKAAKREVKGAMNVRGDSSIAILLKSQLEYARGNYRKAIKLLMALENRTEGAISSMFYNNLGCIYHQLMKFNAASVFFTKALTNSSRLRKEKPLKLSTLSQDKSLFIAYNSGLQYLACGRPVLAARCLQKAVSAFYNQPLFWFRLAECCVMASERGRCKGGEASFDTSEVKLYVVGKGKWRRLAVKDAASGDRLAHSAEKVGSNGQPMLSMQLARLYLLNALHMLNCSESGSIQSSPLDSEGNELNEVSLSKNSNHKHLQGVEAKLSAMNLGVGQATANGDLKEQKAGGSQELISSSIIIHKDISRRKSKVISQAVLANLAYVELELENPMGALSSALSLLQIPDCSRVYAFLGHVYAAEALCLLNRLSEAAEHLSFYISEGNNVKLPFTEEDFEHWQVEKNSECEESNGVPVVLNNSELENSQILTFLKPEEARATLYVNLAAKYAMQGELPKALELVNQALVIIPSSREAILTAVYIHLALGDSQAALAKLKQLNPVRFLSFAFTLNKPSL